MVSGLEPHPFRLGTLSRGATVVEGTATRVLSGLAVTAQGFVRVYVKLVTDEQFVAETVCAWLLRRLSIPSPEPFWISVPREVLPVSVQWRTGERHRICFGTEALPATTLLVDAAHAEDALSRLVDWRFVFHGGMFDELVVNEDRGASNILTDGRGQYWLIDHSHVFGGERWNLESLREGSSPLFRNKLLEVLGRTPSPRRLKLGQQAPAIASQFIAALDALPWDSLVVSPNLAVALQGFLQTRNTILVALTRARLGLDELPLGNLP